MTSCGSGTQDWGLTTPTRVATMSIKQIKRSTGTTASERYLAALADRTFLNLWSYPNLFVDRKKGGKGAGKELCDLLVVCGDDVIIFSDKSIEWPDGPDFKTIWSRWYRRAIEKSVAQIGGADITCSATPTGRGCTTIRAWTPSN
jgi:hypothetical protein